MADLTRTDKEAIVSRVVSTVETRHFDPRFDKSGWRSAVEQERRSIVDAADSLQFESALSDLVRTFGTPDAGFFHESRRKKVPKGLAARFQYCQPNECAPAATQLSDGGDVKVRQNNRNRNRPTTSK